MSYDAHIQYLPLGSAIIAYQVFGHLNTGKVPLLMIHGRGMCARQFLCDAQMLAYLGQPVILLNLRDHGESVWCRAYQQPHWTIFALAQDIKNVCDHLNLSKIHLFGHSLGGVVAMEFVRRYGEMVKTLIISGTHIELGSVPKHLIWFDRTWRQIMGNSRLVDWYAATMCHTQSGKERLRELMSRYGHSVERDLMIISQIRLYDYRSVLQQFKGGLRIIHPEKDWWLNCTMDCSLQFAQDHPRGRVLPVANAGHFVNLDQPEAFAAALREAIGIHPQ